MNRIKIANLQLPVYAKKGKNLAQLENLLREGRQEDADLVMLGEMFSCPYENSCFPVYAEKEGGMSWQFCSEMAAKHRIYLEAGSMPEIDEEGHIYNTAYVFDREGRQIAKHRKAHLFDIDVKGGQCFRESDTLTPGSQVTVFETEFGKMGLCICFDIRFPELVRSMALAGAKVVLVPAAFNRTTGPLHWELLFRSRAADNQLFTVGNSPAGDDTASYVAWGHSIVVDPWGKILMEMDEKPQTAVTEIDLDEVARVRAQLPLLSARRPELYTL